MWNYSTCHLGQQILSYISQVYVRKIHYLYMCFFPFISPNVAMIIAYFLRTDYILTYCHKIFCTENMQSIYTSAIQPQVLIKLICSVPADCDQELLLSNFLVINFHRLNYKATIPFHHFLDLEGTSRCILQI